MRYTATGTFRGRRVSITWEDGQVSGDAEAVAALKQLADDMLGKRVGIPEIETTLYSHLKSALSAQMLIEKILQDESWEGEMPYSQTWR